MKRKNLRLNTKEKHAAISFNKIWPWRYTFYDSRKRPLSFSFASELRPLGSILGVLDNST